MISFEKLRWYRLWVEVEVSRVFGGTWRFDEKGEAGGKTKRVWEKKDASGHPSEARADNLSLSLALNPPP